MRLGWGQHRRRFVEDQHGGVARERLDDLDALLGVYGELADARAGIEPEACGLADAPHDGGGTRGVEPPAPAQRDILGHRHGRHEREVLLHHTEPGGERGRRGCEVHRPPVERDRPCIGGQKPERDAHERALAGAILAEERMHGARSDHDAGVVEGERRTEPLEDAREGERRRASSPGWGDAHVPVGAATNVHGRPNSCPIAAANAATPRVSVA